MVTVYKISTQFTKMFKIYKIFFIVKQDLDKRHFLKDFTGIDYFWSLNMTSMLCNFIDMATRCTWKLFLITYAQFEFLIFSGGRENYSFLGGRVLECLNYSSTERTKIGLWLSLTLLLHWNNVTAWDGYNIVENRVLSFQISQSLDFWRLPVLSNWNWVKCGQQLLKVLNWLWE